MAEINHDTVVATAGHVCVDSRLYPYSPLMCSRCRDGADTLIVVRSNKLNEVLLRSEKQMWQATREILGIKYTKKKGTAHNAKINLIRDAIIQRYREIQLEPYISGKLKEATDGDSSISG